MAPAIAQSPRVKNTVLHVISTEHADDELEPCAAQGLRRARSDPSIGAAREGPELGAGPPDEDSEDSEAYAAWRGRGRELTEVLLWADMVDSDDEPPPGSDGGPPLLAVNNVNKPPAQRGLPVAAGRDAHHAGAPHPGAGTRAPLSAKSRPFVSGLHAAARARGRTRGGKVALVGVGARREGSEGVSNMTMPESRTTVMLGGLPRNFSREMLINMLEDHGYSGSFNFVYLPVDVRRFISARYAFVNLTTPAIAEHIKGLFDGFSGHPFSPSQVCSTEWSRLQGLSANIKHYRDSPIMNDMVPDEYKPVLFADGVRRPFPRPTGRLSEINKPRVRRSAA